MLALSVGKLIPLDGAFAGIVPEIQQQLKYFSPMEFLTLQTVARRIIGAPRQSGISTDDVNVALRADAFLSGAEPEIQDQFHQLLAVFNGALFAFLFEFRFSSFVEMSPANQDSYLDGWMTSALAFRRTAFQALKRISLSLFYTESRTWKEIGYDGMFLPWERK